LSDVMISLTVWQMEKPTQFVAQSQTWDLGTRHFIHKSEVTRPIPCHAKWV